MSIYETMADGLCGSIGLFLEAGDCKTRRGKCLDMALKEWERDPSLKLMMGPKGSSNKEDTAHFWVETKDGKIIDKAADTVWDDYVYDGREVDPEEVLKELSE